MTTCKDLAVGDWYKFAPSVVQNMGVTNATFERLEGHSVIVVAGDNGHDDFEGEHVPWKGHQKWKVVEVQREPEAGNCASPAQVLPASSVPPVTVKREVLTIDKIGVGQTFIVHGKPEEVYVKISNSHVFNHKRLQMHTTDAQRFTNHLNLVIVELTVFNGK